MWKLRWWFPTGACDERPAVCRCAGSWCSPVLPDVFTWMIKESGRIKWTWLNTPSALTTNGINVCIVSRCEEKKMFFLARIEFKTLHKSLFSRLCFYLSWFPPFEVLFPFSSLPIFFFFWFPCRTFFFFCSAHNGSDRGQIEGDQRREIQHISNS